MLGTLSDTSVYSEDDSSADDSTADADSSDASSLAVASGDSAGVLWATGVVDSVDCWHPTQVVVKAAITAADKILFTFILPTTELWNYQILVKHPIANACHDYCYWLFTSGFFAGEPESPVRQEALNLFAKILCGYTRRV
jgi:hypothetical protein